MVSLKTWLFLKPLLEGKRIVQLGENTHGIREYNLIKDRLIRYLHDELGFNVLVFESDFYQCYQANERVVSLSPGATLTGCTYGTWHTTGVLPLFEYLSDTQTTESPLRLAGMDVQPIGTNKEDRPSFLAYAVSGRDPAYAREVKGLDSTFLAVYAEGSKARRTYFRSAEGQEMLEDYKQLVSYLDSVNTEGLVARQTAQSLVWYISQQTAATNQAYVENRDRGMAENLRFIAEVLYPEEKLIVWGHNFHLRHDNIAIPADSTMFPDVAARTMGDWVYDWYQEEVYTVGFYAYEGASADNSGESFDISPAALGSLEHLLHATGKQALFVDLSEATGTGSTEWMATPITARYNGETPLMMRLKDQYDGLVFVNTVTPRVSLY